MGVKPLAVAVGYCRRKSCQATLTRHLHAVVESKQPNEHDFMQVAWGRESPNVGLESSRWQDSTACSMLRVRYPYLENAMQGCRARESLYGLGTQRDALQTAISRYKTEPSLFELKTSYTFDDVGFTNFLHESQVHQESKVKTSSNEMPSHQSTRRYIKKGYFTTDSGSSVQGPPQATMRSPVYLPSSLLTVWSFTRIPLITGGPTRRVDQASLMKP